MTDTKTGQAGEIARLNEHIAELRRARAQNFIELTRAVELCRLHREQAAKFLTAGEQLAKATRLYQRLVPAFIGAGFVTGYLFALLTGG